MKKEFIILTVVTIISILVSCSDFLNVDKEIKDRLTIEALFFKEDYVEEWLANSYSHLIDNNGDIGIGNWPFSFSDDMYHPKYKNIREATYNEETYQDSWAEAYRGIRQASVFIENIHPCEEITEDEAADYKAQARFVRAFYYWKLLQKYGPVPLLSEEGLDYTDSYNALSVPRNTYDECVGYIVSEMALAAKDLPLRRELLSISRPTRGAALSVRAKVLLYAASPLMNGNKDSYAMQLVDDKGKRLLSETYDEEKWARAAAAAKDVIDLNTYQLYVAYKRESGDLAYPATLEPYEDGDFSQKKWPQGYADIDPFESYRSIFNGELSATENPELIFTRGQNQGTSGINDMVLYQLPLKADGFNQTCMTQKQCDAYYMNDGTDCSGKDLEIGKGDGSLRKTGFVTDADIQAGLYKPLVKGVSLQYANREPRFYASVAYNGAVWNLLNATLVANQGPYYCWYYRGGAEGQNNSGNWLLTGIGVKKFVRPTDTNDDRNADGSASHITKKADPAIRYAEILLIYAEALNELTATYQIESWDGTKTHSISRDINELKKSIQPIRIRAGVPDYASDTYDDVSAFRKKLKRERQVEFMGEGHRYFDLRRWKDASEEEATPFYGCNTLMTEVEKEQFHMPIEITSVRTCFAEKTYFWPIHRNELQANIRLTQNPGWLISY
ncbi:RagB/SusD family nutrient uptake outer membrane protein [Parabacteroides sp. Marseille-P3160]|uniref:RagB/SusD family nutrient uptake outer membrane protein n=1 Tax=Parabacteroides sp. Marseille-P3160 TaxID=1917887 RepID=UPI0009BA9994|nr:RagB/SusD family nutrient uptake outer membrane protein [Parabacteroides sp. Marseille-P3160]